MAISSCFRKSASPNVSTFRLKRASRRLIHSSACCCGSMHSGKREARVVRMPFCTDSSSGGRPSELHWLISTSLLSCSAHRYGSSTGMPVSMTSCSQSFSSISMRNANEKAAV